MSEANTFGAIVTPKHVAQAVVNALEARFYTYLKETARVYGYPQDHWEDLRCFTSRSTLGREPEDQLPGAIVVSPGTSGDPVRHGDGSYTADFDIGLALVVASVDEDGAQENAAAYAAAATLALLQDASLGGFAAGVRWNGWQNDHEPVDATRSLGISYTKFVVKVANVMNATGLPSIDGSLPAADAFSDPGPWPTVGEGKATAEIHRTN